MKGDKGERRKVDFQHSRGTDVSNRSHPKAHHGMLFIPSLTNKRNVQKPSEAEEVVGRLL